jgi:predicted transcriptional regulator
MSNDELTKQVIRTSADMLELNEKVDDIKRVQDEHSKRFDRVEDRLDDHIARSEDHFRKTDANFLEIRDLLGQLLQRGG